MNKLYEHSPITEGELRKLEYEKQTHGEDHNLELRQYKKFKEATNLDELQESMFSDIENAVKIIHAMMDKKTGEWIIDVYEKDQPDFKEKGQELAKKGIIFVKTMIWADSFRGRDPSFTLTKIHQTQNGWQVRFDENMWMEVVCAK